MIKRVLVKLVEILIIRGTVAFWGGFILEVFATLFLSIFLRRFGWWDPVMESEGTIALVRFLFFHAIGWWIVMTQWKVITGRTGQEVLHDGSPDFVLDQGRYLIEGRIRMKTRL